MVEFRRTIRCSNCGNDTNLYLSSDLSLNELMIQGKCSRCGNSLQLNYNIVDTGEKKAGQSPPASSEDATVNLDESLFNEPAELPSDAIRDLIGS